MASLYSLFFFFVIIIPSAIIHEYFHGWTAYRLGDPTAKMAGRLTLNPIVHIDLWGTILMPIFLFLISGGSFVFAYAKPVPINPLYFKSRYSLVLTALAGPLANFLTAACIGLVIRLLPWTNFSAILSLIVYANVLLGVFNLLPIPPLDGSNIILPLLPNSWFSVKMFLSQFGLFILLAFLVFGFQWLYPLIALIYYLFTGMPLPV